MTKQAEETFPGPKIVSYQELRRKLLPYTHGWSWAEDSIRDLWLLGAPAPQDSCPGGIACESYPICNHIRRVLIPEMFAKWWAEVGDRQAEEIGAKKIVGGLGRNH